MKILGQSYEEKEIYQKRRKIKKALLQELEGKLINIRLAVLGGATTNDVCDCIEIFLLMHGIKAEIYQSDFNRFYEEAVFDNEKLREFNPDVIYIHTSSRNIINWPCVDDSKEQVDRKVQDEYERFVQIWSGLSSYKATIIQNNFEYLTYRILGNLDFVSEQGRVNYVNMINEYFRKYALENKGFHINDINYLSAMYGLQSWREDSYWYLYKMSQSPGATVTLAKSVTNIIKAMYGKNKKALALDLDNTLWGGIVSEEGKDGIALGPNTPQGEAYEEFQKYLLEQKKKGIVLNIVSKNDKEVGLLGFENRYSVLKKEDFMIIKANWEPKSENIKELAKEINIASEAVVFVDDNQVERLQVGEAIEGIGVPVLTSVENYISQVDGQGYFESISLTQDDLKRSQMYMNNLERTKESAKYIDYNEFLKGLSMEAEVKQATANESERITQLLNKCNQFNLTGKKYTEEDIGNCINVEKNIMIYGGLADKFGDNGIVTALVCSVDKGCCNIDNWVMSCRVLKRTLEYGIMDVLVDICKERGIARITGRYIPSGKNAMVENLYRDLGFEVTEEGVWCYNIPQEYEKKNKLIKIV